MDRDLNKKLDILSKRRHIFIIILIFLIFNFFSTAGSFGEFERMILLILKACVAYFCGITYYELTNKIGLSIFIGVLSLFTIADIIIAIVICFKINSFIKENKSLQNND